MLECVSVFFFFATLSVISFPAIPVCPGTHKRVALFSLPSSFNFLRRFQPRARANYTRVQPFDGWLIIRHCDNLFLLIVPVDIKLDTIFASSNESVYFCLEDT